MKIPQKYKGILYLVLLVIVLPVAVYSFALRGTIVKWNRLAVVENTIDSLRSAPISSDTPSLQITIPNRDIISDGAIINIASQEMERSRVSVEKFTIYNIYDSENVKVVATEMELSGGYKSIVKVIDFIETNVSECRIASLEFRTKKRERQNVYYLSANILLQQVITGKEE